MWIYFIFIVVLLFLAVRYDVHSSNIYGKDVAIKIVLLFLVLLAGLRYRMGTDSIAYEALFHSCPTLKDFSFKFYAGKMNDRIAPLCALFFSIVKTITNEFYVFQLIVCLFINVSIFQTLRKIGGEHFFFTIIILYFINLYFSINCEALRESIAIGCFYLALPYLVERKYTKYYLFLLLAIGFHYGAFLLGMLPFLRNLKLDFKTLVVIFLSILITPVLGDFFLQVNIISLFNGGVSGMVDSYLSKATEASVILSLNGIIADVGIPLICLYFVKKYKPELAKFEFLLIIEIFLRLFSQSLYILYRYDNYLRFINIYYYAAFIFTLYDMKIVKRYALSYLLLISIHLYTSYKYWNSPVSYRLFGDDAKKYILIDPYNSVFERERIQEREILYSLLNKE